MTRCVLVDDDAEIRSLLPGYLDGFGFTVTALADGRALRRELAAAAPDLVVCSVGLKTVGGTPVYRLLWNAHPELKTRFVFVAQAATQPLSNRANAPVVERPITRAVVESLAQRVSRA